MPLRLDIQKRFQQRSDRVKGVDLHPTEPWLLANLYNGNVYIWNINDQSLVKSFEICELPVRAAKFVARKQWVVAGSDDMMIRVYNYNTMDKVKAWEAHGDYIRSLAIHPTLPYVLSSSDDMLIKMWDWDKNWTCHQVFEGHSHYVMQVTWNPKDTNTFASASLDRTVKVWSLGSPVPNFTLEGHEKGVNTVDYFGGGDRPYLMSGADDKNVKVWDYQTKACVQTLEGHSHNVSAVAFHPELPIILTGSEDGTVKFWHSTTYRLENTLNYGMERVWGLSVCKGQNNVAVGYDEGGVVIKIGSDEPVASMDASGKLIYAKHNEIQSANVKSLGADFEITDGERLPLPVKDLGSCDVYPQYLKHNPNGRFVTVCGDGEYIVYTALAWRNKSYGSALEFVWGADPSEYATRENSSTVKIYKNFQEKQSVKIDFSAQGIYGGHLLGVRGQDFICFYDWSSGQIIRRIDVVVKNVYWADNGDLVAIVSDQSFYILKFDADAVSNAMQTGQGIDADGVEEAFDLLNEISETVRTGLWVGDCFVYNNAAWRLNYVVGDEVTTVYHLDKPMFLLGYQASQSKLYLIDKDFSIIAYTLLLSLIEYKTLMMRGDIEAADSIIPTLPQDQLNGVAKFLEGRGFPEKALEVATDPDYKFELALSLGRLDLARSIVEESEGENEAKWRQLGELALGNGELQVAQECMQRAKDLSGMILLYSSTADVSGMTTLVEDALAAGRFNIAFAGLFMLGEVDRCMDLLQTSGRLPEAAFFARTYCPSRMSAAVKAWREDLQKINPKAAESLADPEEYPNLFPNLEAALKAEQFIREQKGILPPSASYPQVEGHNLSVDLVAQFSQNGTAHDDNGVDDDFIDAEDVVAQTTDVQDPDDDDWGLQEEKKE
eukprot:TRINITY_DN12423_c0_g1_i4.p1 TRINITY_DN12423_c0_g1~~TRINITY_DN12423_c0_g1_i4.p1  ORF type:complete len:889 (+),score=158.35 TRINITY_DN12423_c0_g1_i4:94-2760(+)